MSYDIDSKGETMKRLCSCTRFQLCNLPPLELPAAVDNFVYVRITNIDGMKKFFGTLERNRLLLDDLQKMLCDMEPANCKSLFDPALGEIVLVKIGQRFVRGCVICKMYFMTCTIYLIDSGLTMEVGLDQLYIIGEELLKIPPQAFLMLLDIDVEEPLLSNDELNAMVRNTIAAFRLRRMQDAAVSFNANCDTLLSAEDGLSSHSSVDDEDERSVISLCSSSSEKVGNNDGCTWKELISSGTCWRAIYVPTEGSGPDLFYLHFLDGPVGFEDLRIHSTSLFGKCSNSWHKLLRIPDLQYDIKDGEFVQVSDKLRSHVALFYGSQRIDEKQRDQFRAAFACRLSRSAPKPFNDNRYSSEAKLYFTGQCMTSQILDVYVVRLSRRYVLEVEILLPEGTSLFDKMCELNFAQHRWAWKVPSYNFDSINEEQLVQRTDDEDDLHLIFTVQVGNKRNDLIEFQKHLKPEKHVLRNPEVGDICIVECEDQLFRCEIVDMTAGKKSFIVCYVDFGEEQELNGDSLYVVDNQEKIVFETPVFGIKCRLEAIRPAGRGLDIKTGAWSREALKLINNIVPLDKEFRAFIGPPDSSGVHSILVLYKCSDLATTLVRNGLAVYTHCNNYSLADLLRARDLEVQYLNVENGIVYGVPSTFFVWLKDCQNYLEKVLIDDIRSCEEDINGIILYENRYRRVIKLCEKNQSKLKYFLVDEGKTIEFHKSSKIPVMISFSALKGYSFELKDPHAAFFLRTCPALALGFVIRNEKLAMKYEELLLKNLCEKKNSCFNVFIIGRKKNNVYSVGNITFADGTSLVNLTVKSNKVFAAPESLSTNKLVSVD